MQVQPLSSYLLSSSALQTSFGKLIQLSGQVSHHVEHRTTPTSLDKPVRYSSDNNADTGNHWLLLLWQSQDTNDKAII